MCVSVSQCKIKELSAQFIFILACEISDTALLSLYLGWNFVYKLSYVLEDKKIDIGLNKKLFEFMQDD